MHRVIKSTSSIGLIEPSATPLSDKIHLHIAKGVSLFGYTGRNLPLHRPVDKDRQISGQIRPKGAPFLYFL